MEPRNSPKKNNSEEEEEDRIINLPETVLHYILSFLDIKHVVQTSVLSRKWRYVWTSFPFLNFNCEEFRSKQKKRRRKRGEWFKYFVDQVLLLRDNSSNIQSFRLSCNHACDDCDLNNHLNTWILIALRRNVQELYLNVSVGKEFRWPNCLFTCKSLTKLEFAVLKLNLPDSMSLPNLRTLVLHRVRFEGNDIYSKIFASCPVLESLIIRDSKYDQNNINISSFKLKHLVLENHDCVRDDKIYRSIKLYAPNLISFRCKDHMFRDYCIEDISALAKADIDMERYGESGLPLLDEVTEKLYALRMMKFLKAVHNVNELTLLPRFLKVVSGATALLESNTIQFCNLRCLKLKTWLSRDCVNAITYLLKISPNIEYLFLEIKNINAVRQMYPFWAEASTNIEVYWEAGVLLQCMLYHLKSVKIRGVQGRINELMFLETLLKNAMVLEKLFLYTSDEQSSHTKRRLIKFNEQLLTFPRASSSIAISLI